MNVQSTIRKGLFACIMTVVAAAPSWAAPVNITVQSGNFPGFIATFVHNNSTAGGSPIYNPLVGTLMGDLDYWSGGWRLSNIMGVMTDNRGSYLGSTVTISNGWLHDGGSEYAHGYFDYTISGGPKDGYTGTFNFLNTQSANFLTETTVQLWGGDVSNSIGMDFRANISPKPVPEPSTMILFGSGLVGLVGWRYRKAQA
ncbi:PEP-CTERM sorting domain-containing protein [Candidatus Nitronereus thalassa]|uniref:PEP-CTERM sorting domain-containing protein n=1 Tax=Candidatus Nitronereus thalassa TaxID=3020898 RepID=A0ABU3KBM4_9BACT|nr:PEP-CTERM sorting domain-containing protein [Candidatus Nitronereus thalassa]MDT7043910.1 PEP-CTERM sorting domain-containing protein [Candidatus Nitronereus thalassa]